jgi:hypothetical protein
MIAIVNVEPIPKQKGLHLYEVRINRLVICNFTHKREDRLDVLLELAATAVKNHYKKEVI